MSLARSAYGAKPPTDGAIEQASQRLAKRSSGEARALGQNVGRARCAGAEPAYARSRYVMQTRGGKGSEGCSANRATAVAEAVRQELWGGCLTGGVAIERVAGAIWSPEGEPARPAEQWSPVRNVLQDEPVLQ